MPLMLQHSQGEGGRHPAPKPGGRLLSIPPSGSPSSDQFISLTTCRKLCLQLKVRNLLLIPRISFPFGPSSPKTPDFDLPQFTTPTGILPTSLHMTLPLC